LPEGGRLPEGGVEQINKGDEDKSPEYLKATMKPKPS